MESASGDRGAQTVARALDRLKTAGGAILVVGSGTEDAHTTLCHRLCGRVAAEPRYCVFAKINEGICTQQPPTRTDTDHHVEVVIDDVDQQTEPLETIGLAIIDAIDDLEDVADGFETGQLRVGIDSLGPIVDSYTDRQVFRLVHLVRSRIDQTGGIAHFHLSKQSSAQSVRLLEELMDATVELRERDDGATHRWHLHDHETHTEWLEF